MQPITDCPVCGGRDFTPYAMTAWTPKLLHFSQAKCASCGLIASQPQASEEEMDAYYKHIYYQEQWPDADEAWAINMKLYFKHELPLMRGLWRDYQPPDGGSVAEIGCGYGVMLEILKGCGFRVCGVELSSTAVAYCRSRGLDVIEGKVPGVPLPHGTFDLVISTHVIEHLPNPVSLVQEMLALVKPGGVIVVVTEDAWTSQYAWSRLWSRVTGRIPSFHTSCDHTFVFHASQLQQLMMRAGCEGVRTQSFTYSPPRESLHWRVFKGACRTVDRLLGHGDFLMGVGQRGR